VPGSMKYERCFGTLKFPAMSRLRKILPTLMAISVLLQDNKSCCLWTLVWPKNPCFILSLNVAISWVKLGTVLGLFHETGYQVHKICRILLWQNLISSRIWSQWRRKWSKSKTGRKTHVMANLSEKTCFHLDFWCQPHFWQNCSPIPPSLIYFTHYSNESKKIG
jgi:hypothetical protein